MDQNITVVKFGGTSLADANQFQKVADIVRADDKRRYVVVSAPGKRFSSDIKVTDLLIRIYNAKSREEIDRGFESLRERFTDIENTLGLSTDISSHIDAVYEKVTSSEGVNYSYLVSRGEYLNGILMASYLGFAFMDAADLIYFDEKGVLDEVKTYATVRKALADVPAAVIPGFYGSMPDGSVNTFPRGGSDITGSVIARGVEAHLYENWTDVSGFLMADPRIIPDAKCIDVLTYRELRELSYMGASVLQEDAVFPVKQLGIPINVRNTNDVSAPGTMIVAEAPPTSSHPVTGLAGRKGFSVLLIEQTLMNNKVGFMRRVLSLFEKHNISIEHVPTGIDTLSVVFESAKATPEAIGDIIASINRELKVDYISYSENVALVAVAGRNMANRSGTAGSILTQLGKAGINILLLAQSSNEINIIVGVEAVHYEKTIRILYDMFKD